uniref:Uncharacterized protein n=1 Tax=Equus asinus asinus TaxID=83772 RepID=A0A8C4MJ43_EQUAS
MLLYRCKVMGYIEENIHQNIPENMVKNLTQKKVAFFVHIICNKAGQIYKLFKISSAKL